jgi:hypothetical protein
MFRGFTVSFMVWLFLSANAALAELPTGQKTITLASASDRVEIGTAEFAGEGKTRQISIKLHEALFKDHFLSMRPFKCLEGPKFYCHLPYPYEWKGEVSETDLADLEYALLFVQKEPTAYGINLWHGIYYKLDLEAGGRITGKLHEVDMDILASPPKAGQLRPISHTDISATPAASQWLPELVIE